MKWKRSSLTIFHYLTFTICLIKLRKTVDAKKEDDEKIWKNEFYF